MGAMASKQQREEKDTEHVAVEEVDEEAGDIYSLRNKIHSLLKAADSHRVTSDRVRYSLEFIATKLASLALSPPSGSPATVYQTEQWLKDLKEKAKHVEAMLDQYEQELSHQRHLALPRKAAQLLRQRRGHKNTLHGGLLSSVADLYCATEHPSNYRYGMSDQVYPISGLGGLPLRDMAQAAGGLHLVGIDVAAEKLFRWLRLTSSDKRTRVISIVGPIGVGKTTLAMELHRRFQLQTYVQCYAMARVSKGADRSRLLLQQILSDVVKSGELSYNRSQTITSSEGHLEELIRDIRKCLQHKRYFILIDDLWEASDWGKIKDAFPENKRANQILITTPAQSVARSCLSDHVGLVHEIEPLNKRESERLLLIEAFGSVDCCPQAKSFGKVRDEILRRCDGIPLFITGMSSWLKERKRQGSTFYSVEQVPKTLKLFEQMLIPTYHDLPYHLRLLFLYMSMFPQGYRIAKEQLIWKWTAEGLTGENGYGQEAYDSAYRLFSELADRNVIIRMADCKSHPEIEACLWQVNYYMLQILASMSAEMDFVFTGTMLASAKAESGGVNKTRVPRRVALHHPDRNLPELLQTMDFSQTRSLAVSGEVKKIPFDKFVNLVVLDLEGWENLKDDELQKICTCRLYLLKYLSIRNTQVRKLPSEIKDLCCLSTLDISHTQISKLPPEVCELDGLLKMDLRNTHISQIPEQIAGLHRLQHLLMGGDDIVSSDEMATKIPEAIKNVYTLVTLATADLSECPSSFIVALGNLYRLRVLTITWSFHQCSDTTYCDALLSSIKKLRRLESLTIHCGLGCSMEFMGFLSCRPNTLEILKIPAGRFVSVPQWIQGLKYMVSLQITVCKLASDDLKIMADLCRLRFLVLGLEFIPREEIVIGTDGFCELLKFCIDCPVPNLTFRRGAMRKLKYLGLNVCSGPASRQNDVPSGISNLQSLREVLVHYNEKWCTDSSHIKRIVGAVTKEVAEHWNPIDLVINGIKIGDAQKFSETEWETEIQSEVEDETNNDVQVVDSKIMTTTTVNLGEIEAEGGTKNLRLALEE